MTQAVLLKCSGRIKIEIQKHRTLPPSRLECVGIALHQLGHTIGLFHTQTRHDRDNFITPHYENLIDDLNPGWYFGEGNNQFDMESPLMNCNYNITYDFGTVMDYGATAFAKFAMSKSITAKTR
ncbi:Astacin (Peptidase M12A) [Parelaphostrongylus tenuis]|uniref:Metalloendopeptidase n=1 Tax=Parelaphostrongylus tenuis TaxID=148309 RepID=A0AAD5R2G6_PARTN|nr:Astacin (Peptidase M12A) [Parelaphostrongylus tenuis]